jgi:hypothetical protein
MPIHVFNDFATWASTYALVPTVGREEEISGLKYGRSDLENKNKMQPTTAHDPQ